MVNPVTREIDCLSGMIISWRASDFQIPEFDALEQKIKSEIRSPHFCMLAKVGAFVLELMTAFWLPEAHAEKASCPQGRCDCCNQAWLRHDGRQWLEEIGTVFTEMLRKAEVLRFPGKWISRFLFSV